MDRMALIVLLIALIKNVICQGNGALQLFRQGTVSPSFSSGRVQIYFNNQWGNLCNYRGFDQSAADVLCRQMTYAGAFSFSNASEDSFGNDSLDFVLYNLDCNGDWLSVLQCDYSIGTNDTQCIKGQNEVSISCFSSHIWDFPFYGQLRLMDGSAVTEGRVEVYCNEAWGTVCGDDYFHKFDADAVCRQLGYTNAKTFGTLDIPGNSSQPIWLNNVECSPDEQCFSSCQYCPQNEVTDCSHSRDATVQCEFNTTTTNNNTLISCDVIYFPDFVLAVWLIIVIIVVSLLVLFLVLVLIICIPISVCACLGVGVCAYVRSKKARYPINASAKGYNVSAKGYNAI